MKGQWIGTYTGLSSGNIIVNIDERPSCFQGVAYLHESTGGLPGSVAFFSTRDKANGFAFRTSSIQVIDPTSVVPVPWENVKGRYPENVTFSKYADVTGAWDKDWLNLSWTTDIGGSGSCSLPSSKAAANSELVPSEIGWADYKVHVARLAEKRFLFRGQNMPRRLRTSFHRAGRADLSRYLLEDVPVLYKYLSARTRHVFNINVPDEMGAFFSLVQHHGYPTPLLDWTYSPYVAAFFAYRGISNAFASRPEDKVRILVFDQAQWRTDWAQMLWLVSPHLHLSIGEFLAIENERMIPQQAASTVTNVDDIESYIRAKESENKRYLSAIDLPMRDRRDIVRELSYMGITAGSLFPGLDGACEELKERGFEI